MCSRSDIWRKLNEFVSWLNMVNAKKHWFIINRWLLLHILIIVVPIQLTFNLVHAGIDMKYYIHWSTYLKIIKYSSGRNCNISTISSNFRNFSSILWNINRQTFKQRWRNVWENLCSGQKYCVCSQFHIHRRKFSWVYI